jgi:hypothetical protein
VASSPEGPSWDQVDRAWVRPRASGSQAVRSWHRWIGKSLRFNFVLWMLVAVLVEASGILDVALGLGWGYRPLDLLYGLLFILAGCVIFVFVWFVHRMVGWLGGVGEDD